MAQLTADLFATLDGFASGVGVGPFFDHPGPELEGWVRDALTRPHLTVMGRITYEAMANISASATDEISTRMNAQPKVVFSNTLREPLAWSNTRLLRGDLATEIRELKRRSSVPLRSIGSITLVKSMVRLGLVDRLRITIFPLVLGDAGREPIFAGYPRTRLELVDSTVLDSRLLVLEYAPAGRAGEA
ncbi:MAG TPA: dihydrofolate reductase family protein [Candidatus Dormibacteraeota bacterium]|nr:dihydrofolate reductase family protein [Candidatus Dormibacteraeota bacterium]